MNKKIGFYHFYFGFLILFAVLLTVGLVLLFVFLKTYESAQPKSIAQSICDDYLKKGDLIDLKEEYALELSDYETADTVKAAVSDLINGKKLEVFHSSQVPEGSEICFAVKADDKPIAFIALSKKEKKERFGINGYKVDSINLSGGIYKTVKITFPSNAAVNVNGKPLAKEDVVSSSLPVIKDVTFGEDAVSLCTAELKNLITGDVKITVDGGDNEFVITENGDNDYSVNQRFSEDFTKEITDFALEGSKVYAAHMQDDLPLANVGKYVDTSSEFYKNIRNTIVRFAWSHDSYSFENVECSSLMQHSQDIYSCRIKFINVLKLGSRKYNDTFDKRVYVRITGKSKKIIDMQSIG